MLRRRVRGKEISSIVISKSRTERKQLSIKKYDERINFRFRIFQFFKIRSKIRIMIILKQVDKNFNTFRFSRIPILRKPIQIWILVFNLIYRAFPSFIGQITGLHRWYTGSASSHYPGQRILLSKRNTRTLVAGSTVKAEAFKRNRGQHFPDRSDRRVTGFARFHGQTVVHPCFDRTSQLPPRGNWIINPISRFVQKFRQRIFQPQSNPSIWIMELVRVLIQIGKFKTAIVFRTWNVGNARESRYFVLQNSQRVSRCWPTNVYFSIIGIKKLAIMKTFNSSNILAFNFSSGNISLFQSDFIRKSLLTRNGQITDLFVDFPSVSIIKKNFDQNSRKNSSKLFENDFFSNLLFRRIGRFSFLVFFFFLFN